MNLAKKLMSIFQGWPDNYGKTIIKDNVDNSTGKRYYESTTTTDPVTVEVWESHLAGETIGIIPLINKSGSVKWGAIDIDSYKDFDHQELVELIAERQYPLVVCRSKSGGAHVFLFTKEKVPASLMIEKLREIAGALGHGSKDNRPVEVFPKQKTIDREFLANWLNMPYSGGDTTERYAIGVDGNKLSLQEFITLAENTAVTKQQLVDLKVVREELEGAPPCLNLAAQFGFPEGTRNEALFNLGVYYRKARPDDWKDYMYPANSDYLDKPLSHSEVAAIIKSLDRRSYEYKCSSPSVEPFCDRQKCKQCPFGVGNKGYGFPTLTGLIKVDTDPPRWGLLLEWQGEQKVIEGETDDLIDLRRFSKKCFEQQLVLVDMPKAQMWREMLAELMENVQVNEAPPEVSPAGQVMDYLSDFLRTAPSKPSNDNHEINAKKPVCRDGYYYFKFQDFVDYLAKQGFVHYARKRTELFTVIKDKGKFEQKEVVSKKNLRVCGVVKQVWGVPEELVIGEYEPAELPEGLKNKEPF